MAARSKNLPQPFGRFRIVRKLGEGGTGAVYLAEDARLGCRIALKVSHFDEAEDPKGLERFRGEARFAQSIHHPYVCPVYEVGEIGGIHYLTMLFVEGAPLSRLVSPERPWEQRRAAELVRRLALALEAVHERQVIHRDLKPHNIMVRPGDEPMLMDFGLARDFVQAEERLTSTGQAVGTPVYMPPELIEGKHESVGPASDVYSLGLILYELLTGRRPFTAGNVHALYYKILRQPPAAPSEWQAGLDRVLEAVCLKTLEKRPEDRHAGMAELAADLEAYLRPGSGRPAEEARGPKAEEAEPQRQRERAQLQQEGEVKLARLLGDALDRAGGSLTAEDKAAANELVRQHHLRKERAKALVREARAQWEKERPRDVRAVPASNEWWLEAVQREKERPRDHLPGERAAVSLGKGVAIQFAWIPPGAFVMGSPRSEKQRFDDEVLHRVTLPRGFHLGIYPVTQAQWTAILGDNPSKFQGDDQRPVESVSWEDCAAFCRRLGERTGQRFRLPTEAEWEYACRAGTTTPFHFGETLTTDQANYDGHSTYGEGPKGVRREQTTPVGSFAPNAWGLYDMHGNVREWCQDWYGVYPKEDAAETPPSNEGITRVLRGGSWSDDPRNCRCACRSWSEPGSRRSRFGFRVCLCPD